MIDVRLPCGGHRLEVMSANILTLLNLNEATFTFLPDDDWLAHIHLETSCIQACVWNDNWQSQSVKWQMRTDWCHLRHPNLGWSVNDQLVCLFEVSERTEKSWWQRFSAKHKKKTFFLIWQRKLDWLVAHDLFRGPGIRFRAECPPQEVDWSGFLIKDYEVLVNRRKTSCPF